MSTKDWIKIGQQTATLRSAIEVLVIDSRQIIETDTPRSEVQDLLENLCSLENSLNDDEDMSLQDLRNWLLDLTVKYAALSTNIRFHRKLR